MDYNVLIIGAGAIGAMNDSPDSIYTLSYAHAFYNLDGCKLQGFVDADITMAKKACAIWGGRAYHSLAEAITHETVDILCIAVPDALHYSILQEAIACHIPCIITEKPLTKTTQEAEAVIALEKRYGSRIIVNYTRRYVPEFQRIREAIRKGEYGAFIKGVGFYGKGLLHNGSHMVDLLRSWIGEVSSVVRHRIIHDCYEDDPSVDLTLLFAQDAAFEMIGIPQTYYTVFEFDILFEKGRIRMVDDGSFLELYQVEKDLVYAGYKKLRPEKTIKTSLDTAMSHVALHALDVARNRSKPLCTTDDAYKTMLVCL